MADTEYPTKPREITSRALLKQVKDTPKADLLSALFELARRTYEAEATVTKLLITGPTAAHTAVRDLGRLKQERLDGLYLDAQNGLIARRTISVGSLNTTHTHPREILRPAIEVAAIGFILAHNHPSGCLDPSPEDLTFTASVQQAAGVMGIELYDHLIVAASGYASMRERGLI